MHCKQRAVLRTRLTSAVYVWQKHAADASNRSCSHGAVAAAAAVLAGRSNFDDDSENRELRMCRMHVYIGLHRTETTDAPATMK